MEIVYEKYIPTKFFGRIFMGKIVSSHRNSNIVNGMTVVLWTTVYERCIEHLVYSDGKPSEVVINYMLNTYRV